jgi:hypothetical protein
VTAVTAGSPEATIWRPLTTAWMQDEVVVEPGPSLSEALAGTWSLTSGEVRTAAGRLLRESAGDVVALLIYDGFGNFSAQFMRRERQAGATEVEGTSSASNNSRAIGGYDAYFGRYVVDDEAGVVTQTLVGALAPENVGQVLSRGISVVGDELTVRVDTESDGGEPATMTLRWERLSA